MMIVSGVWFVVELPPAVATAAEAGPAACAEQQVPRMVNPVAAEAMTENAMKRHVNFIAITPFEPLANSTR
jgi:hypothetical protein